MPRRGIPFFHAYPELRKYWSDTNKEYSPEDLTKSDKIRKVFWTCDSDHLFQEYPVKVAERFLKSLEEQSKIRKSTTSHCKVCIGKILVVGVNDLQSQAPKLSGMLVQGQVDPATIHKSSRSLFEWECSNGHRWFSTVNEVYNGQGCPHCSGLYVTPGESDLLSQFPDIAREVLDKNLDLQNISKHSHKHLDWECFDCSYVWNASVTNRTFNGSGCPKCACRGSSKPEKFLISLMSSTMTPEDFETRWDSGRILVPDFTGIFGGNKVAIEYDGWYWHKSPERVSKDIRKTMILLDEGFLVIRYREYPLEALDLEHENLLQVLGEPLSPITSMSHIESWLNAKTSSSH